MLTCKILPHCTHTHFFPFDSSSLLDSSKVLSISSFHLDPKAQEYVNMKSSLLSDRKGFKWSKDSEAAKLLRSGLENGDIDPNDSPKAIWESCPVFQQYDLPKFRAGLNKVRTELGLMVRKKSGSEQGGGDDDGKVYGGESISLGGYKSGDLEEEYEEKRGWMPIHTIFNWYDSKLRARLTILVVMPSGVNTRYTVGVTGGGTKLELGVEWPAMLWDPTKLFEPFQKVMEMRKPSKGLDSAVFDLMAKQQEFRKHMKDLERQMDRMESKAEIMLPTTVAACSRD
jgi:hypothetical protein